MAIPTKVSGNSLRPTEDWNVMQTAVENTTSGHDHDGSDSKTIDMANLTNKVEANITFNTSSGHDHDGSNSKRIYKAIRLMHTGAGRQTVTAEADIDSHTFSANDFALRDVCLVELFLAAENTGGGDTGYAWKIQANGAGTGDLLDETGGGWITNTRHLVFRLVNSRLAADRNSADTSDLEMDYTKNSDGTLTAGYSVHIGGINTSNAITTAWTIKIRATVNSNAALQWQWNVWKEDVSEEG